MKKSSTATTSGRGQRGEDHVHPRSVEALDDGTGVARHEDGAKYVAIPSRAGSPKGQELTDDVRPRLRGGPVGRAGTVEHHAWLAGEDGSHACVPGDVGTPPIGGAAEEHVAVLVDDLDRRQRRREEVTSLESRAQVSDKLRVPLGINRRRIQVLPSQVGLDEGSDHRTVGRRHRGQDGGRRCGTRS